MEKTYTQEEYSALLAKNRALTEDCIQLIKLYRDAVNEISSLAAKRLESVERRLDSIDVKLSAVCSAVNVNVESQTRSLAQNSELLQEITCDSFAKAADRASNAMSKAEDFSRSFSDSIGAIKKDLLSEIKEIHDDIDNLRASVN